MIRNYKLCKPMPRNVMRNVIIFVFIGILVVFTNVQLRPSVEAKQDEQSNKYLEYDDDISGMVSEYHSTLNDLFNERIAALNEEESAEAIIKLVVPPKQNAKGARECVGKDGSPNLSTYCLGEAGMVQFFQFRQGLEKAREKLNEKAVDTFTRLNASVENEAKRLKENPPLAGDTQLFGPGYFYQQDELNDVGLALQRIDIEIDIAEKTLDQALTAYNEFQMALPLHKKNQEIIEALEHYRDGLADVRDEVFKFPFKFINVSTTQCT